MAALPYSHASGEARRRRARGADAARERGPRAARRGGCSAADVDADVDVDAAERAKERKRWTRGAAGVARVGTDGTLALSFTWRAAAKAPERPSDRARGAASRAYSQAHILRTDDHNHNSARAAANGVQANPADAALVLISLELSSISAMQGILTLSGVAIPADFAVAYAISRLFRRARLPVELVGAAALRRVVPELADIKLSQLVTGAYRAASSAPNAPSSTTTTTSPSTSTLTTEAGGIRGAVNRAVQVVDDYGACYLISARYTGIVSVLGFYGLLRTGIVDIPSILAAAGVSELGNVAGSLAAAVVLTGVLYPATIFVGGAYIAPALGAWRKRRQASR